MATHPSILAWRILRREESGGLWLTLSHSSLAEKPHATVVSESSKVFFFNGFIFIWLPWVFVAALGLSLATASGAALWL